MRHACPHPEERACSNGSAKLDERARVSKDEDGPHASRRIAAQPSCGRIRARLGCDAPQHEGERDMLAKRTPRAIFAQRSHAAARGGRTNLRLWETLAGSVPLFAACYLQWMAQLQRVEPSARGGPTSRIPDFPACLGGVGLCAQRHHSANLVCANFAMAGPWHRGDNARAALGRATGHATRDEPWALEVEALTRA
jgi:hypothetical protein